MKGEIKVGKTVSNVEKNNEKQPRFLIKKVPPSRDFVLTDLTLSNSIA